jgi:membrane-associated phospholipid phosphatase
MDAKPQSQGEKKTKKRKVPGWLLYAGGGLVLWGLALTLVDVPLAMYLKTHTLPDQIGEAMEFLKCFIKPLPLILLVLSAAISAGATKWRMLGHLGLGLALTTAAVWAGKLLVSRQRPKWFQGADWLHTFTGYLPGVHNFKFQSVPSGDAALAFAMALILAHYFPKHRFILCFLAAGCALSRIFYQLHYLSDVILGVMIGLLVSRIVLYLGGSSSGK